MDIEELGDQVHGDLNQRLNAFDGSMLVKYLTLVEVMDPEGERAVFSLTSKDMKSWESLGMIEFARQLEQAAAVHDSGEA